MWQLAAYLQLIVGGTVEVLLTTLPLSEVAARGGRSEVAGAC